MSAAYNGGLLDVAQLNAMLSTTPDSIDWVAEFPRYVCRYRSAAMPSLNFGSGSLIRQRWLC